MIHISKHRALPYTPRPPHRGNHTSEPAEEHRRREMHSLIWYVHVTLGRLTRAQECEHSLRELNVHDILDGEPPILKQKRALQGIRLLDSVRRKVQYVGWGAHEKRSHLASRRMRGYRVQYPCSSRFKAFLHETHFLRCVWKATSTRRLFADEQSGHFGARDGLPALASFGQSRQCWNVRGNGVIGDAFLPGAFVFARSVNGQKPKLASYTPPNPWTNAPFGLLRHGSCQLFSAFAGSWRRRPTYHKTHLSYSRLRESGPQARQDTFKCLELVFDNAHGPRIIKALPFCF
jgi:hypothetical protein